MRTDEQKAKEIDDFFKERQDAEQNSEVEDKKAKAKVYRKVIPHRKVTRVYVTKEIPLRFKVENINRKANERIR